MLENVLFKGTPCNDATNVKNMFAGGGKDKAMQIPAENDIIVYPVH